MSYPIELCEFTEDALWKEIMHRQRLREQGRCDYCGGTAADPACRFPNRHPDTTVHERLLVCYAAASVLESDEPEEPQASPCPCCYGKGFHVGDGFSEDTVTCLECGGIGSVLVARKAGA